MIELDGNNLTLDQAERVIIAQHPVIITAAGRCCVDKSATMVEKIVTTRRPAYGINTGCGKLSDRAIPVDNLGRLQRNIILSHSTGVGEPLPTEAVRAMILFRINSLLKGLSGIRLTTIDYLVQLLNHKIHPLIPHQGSVGSSGDLIPLAHMAAILLGEGEAEHNGRVISATEALKLINRSALDLAPKEGLALLNGTQYMSALGFLSLLRGKRLLKNAVAVGALVLEGLQGFTTPFDERLHAVRPHPGQVEIARLIRHMINGSRLVRKIDGSFNNRSNDRHDPAETDCCNSQEVQDAYSLRCLPQILGPAWEALAFLAEKITIEINSATDNPLIWSDGTVISGGNFHGQILALTLDMTAMAIAEIGSIAERQTDRLLTSSDRGLPLFLVENNGINSGLMIAQYTAAALVSENKILCHPAGVDSIPTSGGKEDHNSMGSIAAAKSLRVIENVERVVAITFLCAAQALDFRLSDRLAEPTRQVYKRIRSLVPHLAEDRFLARDIDRLTRAVKDGELIDGIL
ncbi:histidine ammonia-lyase [Candidatus Acetothermia bacterium]|nr:histidine ammonia-lyase [Candidatus Acetothermia bacterium]